MGHPEGSSGGITRGDHPEGSPGGITRKDHPEGSPGGIPQRDHPEGSPGGITRRDPPEGSPGGSTRREHARDLSPTAGLLSPTAPSPTDRAIPHGPMRTGAGTCVTARHTTGETPTPRQACVHSAHAPLQGLAHVAPSQRAIPREKNPPRGMRVCTASTHPSEAPHTSQPHSAPYHGGKSHPAACVPMRTDYAGRSWGPER